MARRWRHSLGDEAFRADWALRGCRSAHLGTYRVIYQIDDATETIYVLAVRLRGDVYGVR